MNRAVQLFDAYGSVVKTVVPNLDPYFFFASNYRGNITATDIEARPYQYHVWVHACVWACARNISRLPLVLCERGKPHKQVDDKWGILKRFDRPNPFMTRTTFLQAVVMYLLLPTKSESKENSSGQVFLLPRIPDSVKFDFTRGQVPDVLLPYSDEYIKPMKEKSNGMEQLTGWKLETEGVVRARFTDTELIRINLFNPYDWLKGISSYEPALISMIQDIKADIYNTKLYDNNAIPAGVLSTDDYLSEPQRREQAAAWYEEFGGSGNSQRVAFLSKGLKYQHIGLTQVDMQYNAMKKEIFEKITASFGLNKIAMGKYEELNLATIKEGRKLLWYDTYIPLSELILEPINSRWIQIIDSNIELRFDLSHVEALAEDYTEKATSAGAMVREMEFPPELACRIAGIPLTEDDLAKYPWLKERPTKAVPSLTFGGLGNEEEKPKKPEQEKPKLPPPGEEGAAEPSKHIRKFTLEERDKIWDGYVEKFLSPSETKFANKFKSFFISQRNAMQDRVDEWLKKKNKKSASDIAEPDDFLLDLTKENKRLLKDIEPLVRSQVKVTNARVQQELGKFVKWKLDDPTIQRYVDKRRVEMAQINSTTFKKAHKDIADAIEQGVKDNLTPEQLAEKIKDAISDIGEVRVNQAMTIARTEVGIISNNLRYEIFQEEGIENHEWVTARDEKVRDSHAQVDGDVVHIGEHFKNGLLFPLDPEGDPEDIINCRCVAVATRSEEGD